MSFTRETPTQQRARRKKARNAANHRLAQRVKNASAATMQGGVSGEAVEKREYIRSKALLAAVRLLPCMHTGKVGETEPAHSNWPQHGKAKAVKADDNRVAALCWEVHRELDQGSHWSAEQRQRVWWASHVATVRALLAAGTWPKGVPVPQLEDFWK